MVRANGRSCAPFWPCVIEASAFPLYSPNFPFEYLIFFSYGLIIFWSEREAAAKANARELDLVVFPISRISNSASEDPSLPCAPFNTDFYFILLLSYIFRCYIESFVDVGLICGVRDNFVTRPREGA